MGRELYPPDCVFTALKQISFISTYKTIIVNIVNLEKIQKNITFKAILKKLVAINLNNVFFSINERKQKM